MKSCLQAYIVLLIIMLGLIQDLITQVEGFLWRQVERLY